jgi:hypothetical protein
VFDVRQAAADLQGALAGLAVYGRVHLLGVFAATFAGIEVIYLPGTLAYALAPHSLVVGKLRALVLFGSWVFFALWVVNFGRWVAAAS